MSEYDFILDGITFSFSSLSTFDTCPYCFKLTYIDVEDRLQNAFGEFGLLVHHCLEKFFKKEVDVWDLPEYYQEQFGKFMKTGFPPYPKNMAERYYEDGLNFFESITFNLDDYEIIEIESKLEYEYKDINLTGRPDAIIKEKATDKTILLDFKTSKLYGNSRDKKKIEGYLKQMYLYVYMIWLSKSIAIDEIWIWFVRNAEMKKFPVTDDGTLEMLEWLEETYNGIMNEDEWKANRTKANKFFCEHICSMRSICNAVQEG